MAKTTGGGTHQPIGDLSGHKVGPLSYLSIVVLLLLLPLQEKHPDSAQVIYERALKLFHTGKQADSQIEAEVGYAKFHASSEVWASKFKLLEAEDLLGLGMYSETLLVLAPYHDNPIDPNVKLRMLATEAIALTHQAEWSEADQKLSQGESLCNKAEYPACGYILGARGTFAVGQGKTEAAWDEFLKCVSLARVDDDPYLELSASINLGYTAIRKGHFDEALEWSRTAHRAAVKLDAQNIEQVTDGNIGWAYLELGDTERALDQFLEAEKIAENLENPRFELKWTSTEGYVYKDEGDFARATESYRRALGFARQIDSKEDIANALEDLADVSVDSGKLDEASSYVDQVTPMELAGGGHLSANVLLTEGKLAAARRQDQKAESLYRQVQNDATSRTTTRLNAGNELAQLLELEGNAPAAEKIYKATLDEFNSAQAQLKSEESKLPFVANAANIYDNYIQLLVREGRNDEALALADQSRARTLMQALGVDEGKPGPRAASMNPRQIAAKTGATLLVYWLGTKQSYLWAITPSTIKLFPLAPQQTIRDQVERYNKFMLNLHDPLKVGNQDGQALYKLLVAPASSLIRPNAPVMILADDALSQLNFETLLVPGPSHEPAHDSGPDANLHQGDKDSSLHYWVEDATLLSAPSLAMLAAAKPVHDADQSLLLLGNPVSASDDFPSLPLFGFEMTRIKKHFTPQHISAFDGLQATPAAYLSSNPSHYSYIHFVSHAVASRTDPLDSAIILSDSKPGEDSYKLYARDIMLHPIHARLVTISACYGSGTRSYAGEGLVGLSWAFLRAGARSVIGALWEVSDDSTPKMMDTLYAGIESGQAPAVALRNAKLDLIHSQNRFSAPFYWAPFQIYTTR